MTAILHLWPWALGAAVVLGVTALVLRRRVARLVRLGKALATDKRLPPSVRWCFRVALVAKVLPVDFGIDEVALVAGVVLLATRHRETWRTICAETR